MIHVPAERARGVDFEEMYVRALNNRTEWLAKEEVPAQHRERGIARREREAREEGWREEQQRRRGPAGDVGTGLSQGPVP